MATWPATLPPLNFSVGYSGELIHNTVRTPFEAGYVGTRPRFTRGRHTFRVGWSALCSTDTTAFLAFYSTCQGGAATFSWVDYGQSTVGSTYTVRFQEDSLNWELVDMRRFRVTFSLEEV